jgi:hypothetical protein
MGIQDLYTSDRFYITATDKRDNIFHCADCYVSVDSWNWTLEE